MILVFQLVAECETGIEALEKIQKLRPDLLLLDIEMPEMTGLELAQQLRGAPSYIVFITAYDHYAVKAFEENAIDYVLKPFNEDRFKSMLEKVTERLIVKQWNTQDIGQLIQDLQDSKPKQYLKKISTKHKGQNSLYTRR